MSAAVHQENFDAGTVTHKKIEPTSIPDEASHSMVTWRQTFIQRFPFTERFLNRANAYADLLPRGWLEKLPLLLIAFAFSPRAFFIFGLIAACVLLGYTWAEASHAKAGNAFSQHQSWAAEAEVSEGITTDPNTLRAAQQANDEAGPPPSPTGFLKDIEPLVEHIVRDFIETWYTNINHAMKNRTDVIRHLRGVSMHLAVDLLPRADKSSPIVFEFVHEILATSVLLPIVDMCADPDWINKQIISYLKRKQAKAAIKKAKAAERAGTHLGGASQDEIYVKVLEARRLPTTSVNGLYCAVTCGKQIQKSQKIRAESNPMWMEEFRFFWSNNAEAGGMDGIIIDLTEAKIMKDEVLGSANIPIASLTPNELVRAWYKIDTSSPKFAGTVNAEILIEAIRIRATPIAANSAAINPVLSAESIMVKSEALVEFMEYMDSVKSSHYIQLYIMADSYNRFAQLELAGQTSIGAQAAVEGLKADAQEIIDTFLTSTSEEFVELEAPNLVETIRRIAVNAPTPDMFKPLQAEVIKIIDKRFLEGFFASSMYSEFCSQKDAAAAPESDSGIADMVPVAPVEQALASEIVAGLVSSAPILEEVPFATYKQLAEAQKDTEVESTSEVAEHVADEFHDAPTADDAANDFVIPAVTQSPEPVPDTDSISHFMQLTADVLIDLKLDGTDNPEAVKDAVNKLREHVGLIDAAMRQAPDAEGISDLAHIKLHLQTKVEDLSDMISQSEHLQSTVVDLQHIRINVLDMFEGDRTDDDKGPNIFAFAGVGATSSKDLRYIIQIERVNGSGGWMITKSYADLIHLYESLDALFPKIKKSGFPSRSRVVGSKARDELTLDLERWLNILVPDVELCASPPLQEFMRPENVQTQDLIAKRQMQTKVLGSLRSAGTLLKKGVATPMRAANFVAGEVTQAVSGVAQGVAQGVKKATTINGGSITRPSSIPPPERKSLESHRDINILPRASSLKDLSFSDGELHDFEASIPTSVERSPTRSNQSEASEAPVPAIPPRLTTTKQDHLGEDLPKHGSGNATSSPLSDADLEIVLECLFGAIEEVFALSDPAQWFRQKGLHMVKTLLRRTYGATISFLIQTRLHDATTEEKIASYLGKLDSSLWPEGRWYSTPAPGAQPVVYVPPTEQELADTKMEAKHLFVNSGISGVDTVARVVGKYNTVAGMTRLFNMLQHRNLNQHLIATLIERVVRGLLEK
ncbi:sorting nexin 13 [Thoreauomyces humboldtii]|nr:sorting nexin 13 [Thoreauomyces humboldtii]